MPQNRCASEVSVASWYSEITAPTTNVVGVLLPVIYENTNRRQSVQEQEFFGIQQRVADFRQCFQVEFR